MIPAKRFAKLRLIPLRGFASLARRESAPQLHRLGRPHGRLEESLHLSPRIWPARRHRFSRQPGSGNCPPGSLASRFHTAPANRHGSPGRKPDRSRRTQTILDLYGSRFSESQKSEIARLSVAAQRQLDRLRAYPAQNSDDPALYLKPLIEHERKSPSPIPAPGTAPPKGLTPPPKKP